MWHTITTRTNVPKKRRGRPSEGPYICGNCGKLFHLKIRFSEHQRKECSAAACSTKKKRRSRIKKAKNIVIQKPQVNIRRIFLPTLPSTFENTGEKKYSCPTCNRCYVNYRDLVRHQRYICQKEPQFACNYCDRKFYHRYRLTYHLVSLHPSHLK